MVLDRDPDYVSAEGETLELVEEFEDEHRGKHSRYLIMSTSGIGEGLLIELEDSDGKYLNYYLSEANVSKLRSLIEWSPEEPPGLVEPPMMDFE